LDDPGAEQRYGKVASATATPEQVYEQRWAIALLEVVLVKLREEFAHLGKGELFAELEGHIWAENESPAYAALAERLGVNAGALRVTVHRLRKRYRELLRSEIAHTVASPGEIEEEIRHLIDVMSHQAQMPS
jgi:RNA polymerase sigma-70 factor (ECF subfamily)